MKKKIISFIIFIALLTGFANNISFADTVYDAPITVSGAWIAIDIYHGGYHTDAELLAPFIGNLTAAGNHVAVLNETWYLTNNISALFLPASDTNFTEAEMLTIKNWLKTGDKLLVVAGDSDYGGYYVPTAINALLEYLGTIARLDSTSISDPVNKDGASYRVGVKDFGNGTIAKALTKNMEGGFILHGPCSIIGYNGTNYVDLRNETFADIETIVYYSNYSVSSDSDLSDTPFDLYAQEPAKSVTGNYPAVVYEKLTGLNETSSMIIAGEAFFTFYKKMYNQYTEKGEFQDGITYGQMFANNIINYFVKPVAEEPEPTSTTPVTQTTTPTTSKGSYSFVIPFVAVTALYVILRKKKQA